MLRPLIFYRGGRVVSTFLGQLRAYTIPPSLNRRPNRLLLLADEESIYPAEEAGLEDPSRHLHHFGP